jgi:hypothetical protein
MWGYRLRRLLAALWTTEHSRALLSCVCVWGGGGRAGSQPHPETFRMLVATHLVSEHCVMLSLCVTCNRLRVVLCVMVDVSLSVTVLASCGSAYSAGCCLAELTGCCEC